MKLYENTVRPERTLLVSVDTGDFDAEVSMDELCDLAESAGAEVIATTIQKRPAPDTATCVGEGKLEEIKELCINQEIELVIFDRELTPIQQKNVEIATDVRVIDRTTLILDIFAKRARSREGSLQVELAQLKYLLPRLTGKGIAMSRLGGGIGTRGPGETKLETDRRHIRRRIEALQQQLDKVEEQRKRLRERREKDGVITVALVGYTNAGKSTLMNYLTQANVLAEDKLFATLDPTSRALKLPHGQTVMLIDTVGFLRRLPHKLVEAFKSTLEEAAMADVILNICDASSPEASAHLKVTEELLGELGCLERPVICVMNKCDRVEHGFAIPTVGDSVRISASTGEGVEKLLEAIEDKLPKVFRTEMLIPYTKGGALAEIRRNAQLLSEEHTENGIRAVVLADEIIRRRFGEYIVE